MVKSPDAFRTISEVADWLGIQAHVLRFWESKFTQVKPIKRAGGRRYYRPADMLLLGGIKKLLHDDGLTIKGVQKILREEGMTHVSSLSAPLDELPDTEGEAEYITALPVERERGVVLKFGATTSDSEQTAPLARTATPDFEPATPAAAAQESTSTLDDAQPAMPTTETVSTPTTERVSEPAAEAAPSYSPEPPADDHPRATPDPLGPSTSETEDAPHLDPPPHVAERETAQSQPEPASDEASEDTETATLPDFIQRPMSKAAAPSDTDDSASEQSAEGVENIDDSEDLAVQDDTLKPAVIDLPAFTAEADFPASPGLLTRIGRVRRLPREVQPDVATLLLHLADMRGQMDANNDTTSNF
ncbi:MerR family transcriptional regulator [Sulfitobacter maritimus]|uniref:MerR family transcriptional regulator n=1 Tax=Sulfitobacter maritimus TaxID=2741719 RepID=UPI001FE5ED5D|nr:MerR family transcriptional regulator [Sulfitobacter maritimus]